MKNGGFEAKLHKRLKNLDFKVMGSSARTHSMPLARNNAPQKSLSAM
jgi:hypothetical protein